jgi:hypothetical protein
MAGKSEDLSEGVFAVDGEQQVISHQAPNGKNAKAEIRDFSWFPLCRAPLVC